MKNEQKTTETVNEVNEPKKQKASATYTLRASGENVKKLAELKLISEEEKEQMLSILKGAVAKYVGGLI